MKRSITKHAILSLLAVLSLAAGASTASAQCAAAACATPTCLVDGVGPDGAGCCLTGCATITQAIANSGPGDVISVAAGSYPGSADVPAGKDGLTLCGANSGVDATGLRGPESSITDPSGTVIASDDVVIDGFTIEDATAAFVGFGLDMGAGTTGTQVYNNIIQDNIVGIGLANTGVNQVRICQNQIQNNNAPGAATGSGIYTDEYVAGGAVTDVLIEDNAFVGNVGSTGSGGAAINISHTATGPGVGTNVSGLEVRTNTFDGNARAFVLFNTNGASIHNNSIINSTQANSAAVRIFDNNIDLSITFNDIDTNAGHCIRMTDADFVAPAGPNPSSGVVISANNIVDCGLDGLLVDPAAHAGPVNAECNWWGTATGPNTAGNETVVGDAISTPWLVSPSPAPASGPVDCSGGLPVPCTSQPLACGQPPALCGPGNGCLCVQPAGSTPGTGSCVDFFFCANFVDSPACSSNADCPSSNPICYVTGCSDDPNNPVGPDNPPTTMCPVPRCGPANCTATTTTTIATTTTTSTTTTSTTTTIPVCGDGFVNGTEECDASSPNGAFCPPGEQCVECVCDPIPTTTTTSTTTTSTTTTTIPICGDGFVNGTEECDASSPNGAFCPPGEQCVDCSCDPIPTTTTQTPTTTTIQLPTTTTVTPTTTTSTTTTTLGHFSCYEVKPAGSSQATVTVQDQFGTLTETARFPHRLCAPANKNNEDPAAPSRPQHLAGYTMTKPTPRFERRSNQTIVNQFGTIKLDVTRPDFLFLPTAKSLTGPTPPLQPPTIDHFQCYKVKRTRGEPRFARIVVTAANQLEPGNPTPVSLTLIRPSLLCAPANKNGEDPTAPTHVPHLMCYKTKSSTRFGTTEASINNQFGPDQVTIIHRRELCVPSVKNP